MTSQPDQFKLEEVVVALAAEADHPDVYRLYEEGVLEGQVRDNDTGADVDNLHAGYFDDEGASGFWVARHQGQVVGMVGVQRTSDNSAEIRRLRVHSDFRRRGVGTLLMKNALQFCRDKGYLKVVLDVRIERAPAIALFEKFGFLHGRTREIDGRKLLDFYLDLYREPGT